MYIKLLTNISKLINIYNVSTLHIFVYLEETVIQLFTVHRTLAQYMHIQLYSRLVCSVHEDTGKWRTESI